ncbi:MAG TPA: Crp/Fnr family transcriptional regulator [Terriglobales bacterium]|nr:Crp/Fnr family transcriptional regulator [Terriglobales bacterium]
MSTVHAPYNLEMSDNCLNCQLRGRGFFCQFAGEELRGLAAVSYSTVYPENSVLFVEGQMPRGVYILCRGRAKLSMVSSEGKTLILHISEPGDILGLSSCLLSQPYQATVETLSPCQLNFIRREDFLHYIRSHPEAMFRVAEFLSREYRAACTEIGSLGLAHSAAEKMARLLLDWKETHSNGNGTTVLKLTLTHEEMAQMIGSSRETVTRMLARFRAKNYIEVRGSTLVIRNRAALQSLADQGGGEQGEEAVAPPRVSNVSTIKRSFGPGPGSASGPRARSGKSQVPALQLSAR